MDPIEKKALDFLTELARVINFMQMYNEKHPTVKDALQKAYRLLEEVLRVQPTLNFGKGEDVLMIQNKQITEKSIVADKFIKMLGERNMNGVVMRQGAPMSELEAFVKLMSSKADQVVKDGQIIPDLLKNFKKISLNEIKYLMVGEDENLESLTEARKFFNTIFSEEFKNLKGTDALNHIGKVIQKILPKLAEQKLDGSEDELWEFFEKSVSTFGGGGIRQTRQGLLTAVKGMDPNIQKSLFGEVIRSPQQLEAVLKKFSKDRKASLLVDEVNKGTELNSALDSLLQSKGEIVQLAEALAKKLGGSADEDKLDKIFGLLQQMEAGERIVFRKRGKVIIAEPDKEFEKQYQDLFAKLNFETEVINNGRELLQKIRIPANRPDLLVMDVKLPGLSGLEVLNALDMEKIRTPVVLCTEMVAMKNAFEVQMYPKLKFLTKPFNYKDFMDGVDELCPKIEEKKVAATAKGKEDKPAELSDEMKAEMNKAREIQRNLMPAKFPDTPGYDLYGFYKPFDQVGGDYYDVFAIGGDHVGIMIADVSGHGISGAMVMVMVRSAIRTWTHTTTSPKELLTKVNPIVVRDILPGMFVTVYYAVVNMPEKKVTCACAGHNPALLWRSKTKTCAFTQKGGMPLGIMAGKAFENTVKEETIQLEVGDRLTLYTDGVVETKSPSYEDFGDDRFINIINKLAFQPSQVFINQIMHALTSFQSTAMQNDDITLVTIRAVK